MMLQPARVLALALLALAWASAPAAHAQDITRFRLSKSEGFFSHDINVFYEGDFKLEEVKATLTIFFENGTTKTIERYYGVWNTGAMKVVNFPNNSEGSIQRVQISGTCFHPSGGTRTIGGNFLFDGR